MRKTAGLMLCTLLVLTGCGTSQSSSAADPSSSLAPISADAYETYAADVADYRPASSWTAAVRSQYKMVFSDETRNIYGMDGVLEADASENAHMTQYIEANGLNSQIEGYYYDGTLYNTYNGINYYEEMTFSDVRNTMLVPMDPYAFPENMIASIDAVQDGNGNRIYTVVLNELSATDLFLSRYDFYGLSDMDSVEVTSGTVKDTFDAEGNFLGEVSSFEVKVKYSGQEILITYSGEVSYMNLGTTDPGITDDLKTTLSAYPHYTEIDTAAISDADLNDDTPEATVAETFRKRLINRLGYTVEDDGRLTISYNDREAYTVDFNNHTFMYSNYSIDYVYSWQGDVGSMGKCTYRFEDGQTSADCQESTVGTIQDVKNYLRMELYYCGLSLEDLMAETQ